MTLLEQIQNDLVACNSDLGTVLRRCKVLAARLGSKPLEDWLIWESNGYPGDVPVPDYRQWALELRGYFVAGSAIYSNLPIPLHYVPQEYWDKYVRFRCRDSIAAIQQSLKKDEPSFAVPLTNLLPMLQVYQRQPCLQCWGEFSPTNLIEVLNTVRNRALDFVLALEKEDPKAGEVPGGSSKLESAKVNQIFNMTIQGGVANVLGTAQDSSVTFNVQAGNFESLKTVLENNGVDKADIEDLRKALEEDPTPTDATSYGPHVSEWIAKMTGKAASGAWKVSLGAAGSLLAQAIARYYGLSP